jgi:hypothetical protein
MNLNQYIKPMLFGKELSDKLTQLPNKVDVSDMTATERLEALQVLHDLYIPSFMSVEIYTKLHLMLTRSFQRKSGVEAVQQANLNHHHLLKNTMPHLSTGVGSADSMSILGESGIGKSSSIGRAMQLISDELIIVESPFRKILPFIKIETPFDASVKTVLVDIARTLDSKLGTNYLNTASRTTMSSSRLIALISNLLLLHVGVVVFDEFQNVVINRTGRFLMGMITTIVNSSRVGVCFVGTAQCKGFFQSEPFLARRTLGISYSHLPYDEYFRDFCKTLFDYQFTSQRVELDEGILSFLYQSSQGIIAHVVSLVVQAQELAILNKTERLDLTALKLALFQRMGIVAETLPIASKTPSKRTIDQGFDTPKDEVELEVAQSKNLMRQIAKESKDSGDDPVELLRGNIEIVEIAMDETEESL